jgi:hypothetical protein
MKEPMTRPTPTIVAAVALLIATAVTASGSMQTVASVAQGSPISGRNPSSTTNELAAVSAVSATDVWAVGNFVDDKSGATDTLILRWDGTAWSQVASPNPSSTYNTLWGVSAVSKTDAWAVGDYSDDASGSYETVLLHWDGASWSRVTSPSLGTDAFLLGVSARSASDAWAIGYYNRSSGDDRTLVLHWDGTTWSRVRSPNPNPRHDFLLGVTAVSVGDVWAVGYTRLNMGDSLVLHWNGARWSTVPSPNPSGRALLYAVSADSARDAWAVGGTCCNRALILRWNGTGWHKVKTGSRGGVDDDHFLNATSAVSRQDAWAVGYACKRRQGDQEDTMRCHTLTEHWDGSRWSRVRSPNPSSSVLAVNTGIANELTGVSAISATDAWAVGAYTNDTTGARLTLILHWDGRRWSRT